MRALTKRAESEIIVKKSKFIAIALPCNALDNVKPLIQSIWKEHPNASHVVHAAVIGKSGDLFSFSDDKEPKNTAGRPVLEVLRGSGVTNILVCIVRYFGGTLLGTGGLVKAYGDSCKAVLSKIETEELVERLSFKAMMTYDFYAMAKKLFLQCGSVITDEDFSSGVTLKGLVPEGNKEELKAEYTNLTQGKATLTFID